MRNKAFFLFLIFPLLVSSCRPSPRRVERAFYYWKSVFTLRPEDRDYLRRMKIDKLYVKFFDVVWETAHNQPVPVSVVRFASKMPAGIAVVPTVFITEEVLRRSPADGLPRLAADIGRKAREIQDVAGIGACREIQIDCDWTEGSKAAYFALLAAIRAGLPPGTALSATIRLHQVRYSARTGVPPVDRGMLMFYNLEAPSDFGVRNSILAFETGREYLADVGRYPLPLDVALPLYSWGVVFQGESCMGLIGGLTRSELERNPAFAAAGENLYRAEENVWIRGTYVFKNDRVRVEESDPAECLKAARFLAARLRNQDLSLALFHFDPELLEGKKDEALAELYRSMR